jgi:hypothetical protein
VQKLIYQGPGEKAAQGRNAIGAQPPRDADGLDPSANAIARLLNACNSFAVAGQTQAIAATVLNLGAEALEPEALAAAKLEDHKVEHTT